MKNLAYLLMMVSAAGCGGASDPCDGKSDSCVTARIEGNATGLDQLAISVDMPGMEKLSTPTPPAPFDLPVQVALVLPGVSASVNVSVDGLGGGRVIAHDAHLVTLTGGRAKVTFTLDANGPLPDLSMGGGGDGGDGGNPCPTGQQDNDHDGVCKPDCATAAPLCGVHQICSDASGTATCVCANGYVMAAGSCVWGTVPLDPGFQNQPMAWTAAKGAAIEATAPGNIEPGQIRFDKNSYCTSRGVVTQTVKMPLFVDGEPLMLKVAAQQDCTINGGVGPMPCTTGGTNVVVGGGVNFFAPASVSAISTSCLGERAFAGGSVDIIVRPWDRQSCAGATGTFDLLVDHVDIEPSASCPPPSSIPNNNFDGSGNWVSSVQMANSPPPISEIKPGVGTGGTSAAHLFTGDFCQGAFLDGLISPPLSSMANLALQLTVTGTAGESLFIESRGTILGTVVTTGVSQTAKLCLLESAKGNAVPLRLAATFFGGTGCGAHTRDFVIDDLTFVSDPTCAATAFTEDGTFERTDPAHAYLSQISNNGVAGGVAYSGPSSAAEAHGGSSALKLVNNVGCGNALATLSFSVPPSSGTSGPALRFFYKAPVLTNSNFTISGSGVASGNLPVAAAYTQKIICLDPTTSGQTLGVTIGLNGNGAVGCGGLFGAETVLVDDMDATTDPSCQAD